METVETWFLLDGEAIESADGSEESWWRVGVYRYVEVTVIETDGDDEYDEAEPVYWYSVQRKESGTWTKWYDNPALGHFRKYFEEWLDMGDLVGEFAELGSARTAAIAELRRLSETASVR